MKPALFSHVIRRIRGGGKGGRKHWKSENSGDHYFNYLKYFAKHINTSKIHFLIFIGYLKTHLLGIKRVAFSVKLSHFHLSNYCLRMRKRENTTFRRVLIAFIFSVFICHLQAHLLWFNDLTLLMAKVQCTFYLSWEFSA